MTHARESQTPKWVALLSQPPPGPYDSSALTWGRQMAGSRGQTQHEASFAVICEERLQDFIDGKLPGGTALRILQHLSCTACAGILRHACSCVVTMGVDQCVLVVRCRSLGGWRMPLRADEEHGRRAQDRQHSLRPWATGREDAGQGRHPAGGAHLRVRARARGLSGRQLAERGRRQGAAAEQEVTRT